MSNLPGAFTTLASSSDGTKVAGYIKNYGIFLSTNSGNSWSPAPRDINSALNNITANAEAFITSSADGSRLALCSITKIYLSSDSGLTWSIVYYGSITGGHFSYITSSSDGTILAATKHYDGIYVSTNSGSTWLLKNGFTINNDYLTFITSTPDGTKMYCPSNSANVFYFSLDSGSTWSTVSAYFGTSIAVSDDGTKLALTGGGAQGIYLSNDSGNSWSNISFPSGTTFSFITSNYDRTKLAAICYIQGFNSRAIYYSTDSGNTWRPMTINPAINSSTIANLSYMEWKCIRFNFDFTKIVASYSDNFSSNFGTVLSSNSGSSWIHVGYNGPSPSGYSGQSGQTGQSGTTGANLVCFKKDSQILTSKGYVAIQNLKKGDLIKTIQNGFVPVYKIGFKEIYNPSVKERIKDQLYLCSKKKYPDMMEDLVITGCHSILVDDFKEGEKEETEKVLGFNYVTDYKYRLPACVDKRAEIYGKTGNFTIYHIALENDDYYMNYGIFANGLLVETCSKRYLEKLSDMTIL